MPEKLRQAPNRQVAHHPEQTGARDNLWMLRTKRGRVPRVKYAVKTAQQTFGGHFTVCDVSYQEFTACQPFIGLAVGGTRRDTRHGDSPFQGRAFGGVR